MLLLRRFPYILDVISCAWRYHLWRVCDVTCDIIMSLKMQTLVPIRQCTCIMGGGGRHLSLSVYCSFIFLLTLSHPAAVAAPSEYSGLKPHGNNSDTAVHCLTSNLVPVFTSSTECRPHWRVESPSYCGCADYWELACFPNCCLSCV